MPRKNTRRPGIRAVITEGASCLWPRCPELRKKNQVMCMPHWCRIPRHLRDALKDAAAADGRDSRAYADAVAAITDCARRKDVADQMAGAA